MDIRPFWRGTPNYTELRGGHKPELITIHITESWTMEGTREWFLNPAAKVSSHYLVGQDASVDQFVDETDQAWTQGRILNPTAKLLKPGVNPNKYCISIEHEGMISEVWPEKQRERSAIIIAEIHVRWKIPLDRDHVIGHYEIFSTKPSCPGPHAMIEDLIARAIARL